MMTYRHYGIQLLLALLLLVPSLARAETYWDTDFEVGGASDFIDNGWTDFAGDGFTMCNTWAKTGSRSVCMVFNGSPSSPGGSIYKDIPAASDFVFGRINIRHAVGFCCSTNTQSKILNWQGTTSQYPRLWLYLLGLCNGVDQAACTANGSSNNPQYVFIMEGIYLGTATQGCTGIGTMTCYSGALATTGTFGDDVEWEYRLNTPGQSNGILRLWVNGVLRINKTDGQFRGPTPTSISTGGQANYSTTQLLQTQIYLQSGVGTRFIDRYAAGSTRIGAVGDLAPSDTTAPTIPTTLGIR